MSSSRPDRRSSVRYQYLALLIVISLLAAIVPLPARFASIVPTAEAASAELFFSEYIEGSSNNKALEIYNSTGVAIDLAAAGYKVEFYSNGSPTTTTSNTFNLVGTIPNNGTFVLAPTNANATILTAANQLSGSAWFNGDDAVVLKKGSVIVDSIGQVGFRPPNPPAEWGTGLTSTLDNTLRRKAAICAGDTNAFDVFNPATEWDGFATDTFNGLGSHTATCGPTPPSGVGSATPNSVKAGGQTTLSVNITPGTLPPSTGINVVGDLSSIGGSATQQFNSSGGSIFSFVATVADITLPGVKTLPITITDNEGRNGSASIKLHIQPDSLDHLVISQVYGGGGNAGATLKNDFIELYNPTVNAVSLNGWTVQYASSGGSTWSRTDLAGTLAPGEYYLIQEANGTGGTIDLTSPNAIGTIPMGATDGKVALVSNSDLLTGTCPDSADVVDFVGYGSANCFEGLGSAPVLTNTTAALRNQNGNSDTDNNVADFTSGSPNPRFSSGGNGGGVEVGPYVFSTSPSKNSTNVLVDAGITVNFSEPVAVGGTWYSINCASSGAHAATASGGPTSFKLDPSSDFANSEQCTVTISGNLVTDQDVNDPPNQMAADYSWTFTTVGSAGIIRDPNEHLVMGNPSGATADVVNENNYLMKKPEFALSYNRSRAIPNWTSWHLDSSWRGSQTRTNTFRADPDLPAGWYHVNEFSYSGSGFDRGHMTPSADRTFNFQENAATFLMTNMIPQAPNNNQVTWEGLESYARSLLTTGNEVYIISGGYGQGGTGSFGGVTQTIDQGRIVVPAKTWKVLLVLPNADGNDVARVTTSTRTIAVIMPNAQGINADWRNFIVSVDDVEELTGYDFFSNVPEAIQSVIEANRDGNTRPVANAQSVTVQEDGSRSITLTGTDADNNSLTYTITGAPSHGSLIGGGTTYTYTPDANYNGPDSFTFTVKDAYVPSESATVSIEVTAVNDPPVANAGVDQLLECAGLTSVTLNGSGSDLDGDTPLSYDWREGANSLGTGSTLGVQLSSGLHTITLKVTDPSGAFSEDTVNIDIVDTTAPTILSSGAAFSLWPLNKKYHAFNVSDLVQGAGDSCDSGVNLNSVVITKVTSDEGTAANNDIIIGANCRSVQLRADRNGNGDGRVYTITFRVSDSAGNQTTLTRQVIVPHDQGNSNGAIDSGIAYTVLSSCP